MSPVLVFITQTVLYDSGHYIHTVVLAVLYQPFHPVPGIYRMKYKDLTLVVVTMVSSMRSETTRVLTLPYNISRRYCCLAAQKSKVGTAVDSTKGHNKKQIELQKRLLVGPASIP